MKLVMGKRRGHCRPLIAALLAALCLASWAAWETQAIASPESRAQRDQEARRKTGRPGSKGQKRRAGRRRGTVEKEPPKCPVSLGSVRRRTYPIVAEPAPFAASKVYRPKGDGKYLSVVVLHGSEGGSAGPAGFTEEEAKFLAQQGYAALVFCYFDCERKPGDPLATLKEVEATKVLEAVTWLRQQPFSSGKVVAYGKSRGAELALISGSLDAGQRAPDALIAHSPSDTFNQPINENWEKWRCWLCPKERCSSGEDYSWDPKCGPDDPRRMDFLKSAWLVHGSSVPDEARIPIEKFSGPILITVGEKDELWPVDQTRRIEASLKQAGRRPEIYYFPAARHIFKKPADAACADSLLLDFLSRVERMSAPGPGEARIEQQQKSESEEAAETGPAAPAR